VDTFSIIRNALAASEGDASKAGLDARTAETGRIVMAVQSVVDALTPPDGGRYVVAFSDISTAMTELGARRITVSSAPLKDRSLSMVEKAVVIATLAAHEIGHTLVTRPRGNVVERHNAHSGFHAVANLADDIILEPHMAYRYPILEDAFAFTGMWVLRNTAKTLPKVTSITPGMTPAERFNVLISATRYGDVPEIVWSGTAALEAREWARDWAARLIATPLRDDATFIALCDEAWVWLRTKVEDDEPVEIDPPTQPGGETGEDGEPEPGESDEDEDGEGGSGPSTDDEPTDEEGEDEGEGGSGESDDEEGDETDGEGAGDGEDESDEDGSDESSGTKDGGESMDFGDESDADGESEGEGEGDDESDDEGETGTTADGDATDDEDGDSSQIEDDAAGGGGNANANDNDLMDEDAWNEDEVDDSIHDKAEREPYDYEGSMVEQQVRTYASTTVTAFGHHGTMSTEWT
jgi:hypothetical protein